MFHLILAASADLQLPLLTQLSMTLNGDPVALQDVGDLLLLLVLSVFLLTLGVVLIVPVLMLVLGVAALKNKCLVVGCS